MRDLKIAYGNSRKAKFWSNKSIKFDALCDRLRTPIRTSETAEEYPKLPKSQRDDIKDKGGFVAGHLRGNRRQANKIVCRSMLVYDLDNVDKDICISNLIIKETLIKSSHYAANMVLSNQFHTEYHRVTLSHTKKSDSMGLFNGRKLKNSETALF